jgi:ABC-type nitrate/sulfonate/bicarbonate transport system permease component
MEGPDLPDDGILMSVINSVQSGGARVAPSAAVKTPWSETPALYRYGFLVVLLIVWEIVGPFISPIFFTYPSKIAVAFYDLTLSGELPYYLGQSLEVMIYGLTVALIVGIPLGIAMARFQRLDWALDLPINALYATPLVAVVPLLVLWFGIYLKAKIIVVFLFAVFPVLINTYQGVRECDKNMLEVAKSFRSGEWAMWQDVLLPFAVPYIIAGIRLAIGRGLIGMIIAEFYTTISGLGFMITRYANVFEMDKVFVPVIVLMVLGVSLTSLLKWAGRRLAPWSAANR